MLSPAPPSLLPCQLPESLEVPRLRLVNSRPATASPLPLPTVLPFKMQLTHRAKWQQQRRLHSHSLYPVKVLGLLSPIRWIQARSAGVHCQIMVTSRLPSAQHLPPLPASRTLCSKLRSRAEPKSRPCVRSPQPETSQHVIRRQHSLSTLWQTCRWARTPAHRNRLLPRRLPLPSLSSASMRQTRSQRSRDADEAVASQGLPPLLARRSFSRHHRPSRASSCRVTTTMVHRSKSQDRITMIHRPMQDRRSQ